MMFLKTALSGAAIAMFIGTASFAQGGNPVPGERVDAAGMPTTHSTPAEQAETAQINSQVGVSNAAVDAKAATGDAQYQAQQQQYQNQLQQNQAQQQDYQDRTAAYASLQGRYAAERAAYHRGMWPDRYSKWVIVERDAHLIGERVQLITGSRVGTVIDTAHVANGNVSALLVKLDDDKIVWIDASDVRYNRADGIVMTNLDRADLSHMADERV
jgi:multidrug efflux pump subunit AcrA (membrane-fusion protein)